MEIPERLLIIPLAVVRPYRTRGISRHRYEELLSEANLALVQACHAYKASLDLRADGTGAMETYVFGHVKLSTRRAYLRMASTDNLGLAGLKPVLHGHRAEMTKDETIADLAVDYKEDPAVLAEINDMVSLVRRGMDQRRWRLLNRYFLQGVKLSDIAKEEGVSYQRVQKLVSVALNEAQQRLGLLWNSAM
jgi:RNA polymerase sigma factor (sigma-70 family)